MARSRFLAKAALGALLASLFVPAAATGLTGGIDPTAWQSIGPANLGGPVTCLVTHPTNASILWAGAAGGGIWKSVDGGTTWTHASDNLASLRIGSLAIDPANPNVLYAGTGTSYSFYRTTGLGMLKSTDGGATWTSLAATANSTWQYVNRIAVSHTNSQVVLVAQDNGIFRSADGGTTWTLVQAGFMTDIETHPTDGNKAIAGGFGTLWVSDDAGLTWTAAPGLTQPPPPPPTQKVRRTEVAYARNNPTVAYALEAAADGNLYRSTDGGHNYTLVTSNHPPLFSTSALNATLWVDPTNANRVILGSDFLYLSSDAGATFTGFGFLIPPGMNFVTEAAGFPTNKNLFIANVTGVYRHADYTLADENNTNLSNGLAIAQIVGGDGNKGNGVVMGAARFMGTIHRPVAGGIWFIDGFPNLVDFAGFIAADPVVESNGNSFYYASQKESYRRFQLGADNLFLEQTVVNNPNIEHASSIVPPILADPNGQGVVYVYESSLWKVSDPKVNPVWTAIKPAGAFATGGAIAVSQGDSNVIWACDNTGGVFFTTNGTAPSPTWTSVSPVPAFSAACKDLVIHPTNHGTVYAAFSDENFVQNPLSGSLWVTTNSGASWTKLSSLPDVPVYAVALSHLNPGHVIAGTYTGIYVSADGGTSWANEGPAASLTANDLFYVGNTLYANTDGRGVFGVKLNNPPSVQITSPSNNQSFTAGSNVVINANASDSDGTITKVEFLRGSGVPGNIKKIGEDTTAPYSFTWLSPPGGTYVLTARATDSDGDTSDASVIITVADGTGALRIATADAYVRDGSNANTNFGTATSLQVKTTTVTGNNRDAYLKFSVSSLTGMVRKARLRVFGGLNNPDAMILAAFGVASTSWSETGITFNNKPPMGSQELFEVNPITQVTPAIYELDVTDYVRNLRTGGASTISLGLHSTVNTEQFFSANSREASTNKPTLDIGLSTPTALFVVGNTTLGPGDTAIRNRLQALGFTVTTKTGTAAVTGDATGKALVLISATVTSGSVNTKFRDVAVPVVNWEQALQDDMGFTGNVSGVDFGNQSPKHRVHIVDTTHYAAAGLTGDQDVTTTDGFFNWGHPAAGAAKIASFVNETDRIADYAYEIGSQMVGLTAPARRVNLFMDDDSASIFTAAGFQLFDAAVIWASGL